MEDGCTALTAAMAAASGKRLGALMLLTAPLTLATSEEEKEKGGKEKGGLVGVIAATKYTQLLPVGGC
jgi:hypothetical protein